MTKEQRNKLEFIHTALSMAHGSDNVLVKDLMEIIDELKEDLKEEYEPYFGWCNVEGCESEGANGGGCWRETGYWTVCSKHASMYRAGEPQPPMKQWAIDREKGRRRIK